MTGGRPASAPRCVSPCPAAPGRRAATLSHAVSGATRSTWPRPAISPPRKGRRGAGRLPLGRSSESSGFDKKGRKDVGPWRNRVGHGGSPSQPASWLYAATCLSLRAPLLRSPLAAPQDYRQTGVLDSGAGKTTRAIGTGEQPQDANKLRTAETNLNRAGVKALYGSTSD